MDAKIKAEIERKASAGLPLAGDQKGMITAENLAYWQSQMTANAAARAVDNSSQTTGSGVGTTGSGATGGGTGGTTTNYPGNTIIPDLTKDGVTGYGFTAVVGLGVAFLAISLISGFRRVRGR